MPILLKNSIVQGDSPDSHKASGRVLKLMIEYGSTKIMKSVAVSSGCELKARRTGDFTELVWRKNVATYGSFSDGVASFTIPAAEAITLDIDDDK